MGLFSTQLSTKTLVPLCRQMATAYGAGLPILRSLDLVRETTRNNRVKEMLADIRLRIVNGDTLANAVRAQDKLLPNMLVELWSTGEMGGKLDIVLRDLANYYEDKQAMTRAIIAKAAYPICLLIAAWFIGTFALTLVKQLNFESKVNLGDYVSNYGAFQFRCGVKFAVLVVLCIILSRLGVLPWIWGAFTTHIWPLSAVTRRFAQARFFRCLSLLLSSGVSITRSVERAAATTSNPYIQQDFLKVIPVLSDGGTLVDAFSHAQYLSPMAREMLRVGEESGDVEGQLRKVAQYQMDEATHAVNIATRVGEVAIAMFVFGIVGFVIISFWSNYFKMFDEILK